MNYDTMSYWNKASQSDSWNNANFLRIIKYQNQGVRFEKNLIKVKKIPSKVFIQKIKIIFFQFSKKCCSKLTEYFQKFHLFSIKFILNLFISPKLI